jgi:uncharacterized protein YbcI
MAAPVRDTERGRALAAISNGMVRLHKEAYGRGAEHVHTIWQRNYIVSFLEDIYTPVERTLLDAGERDAVRDTRLTFQRAMEGRFTELVEDATGRKVIGFMSQVTFEPDMAAEIFVLEPGTSDDKDESGHAQAAMTDGGRPSGPA